jgi:hypothetical protein
MLAPPLDRGRDGRRELLEQLARLRLEPFPIGAAGELAQLLLALGDAGGGDPEAGQLRDPLVDVVLERLRGLALLAQRLGLLLEDPRQPGRGERPEAPRTGRRSPP